MRNYYVYESKDLKFKYFGGDILLFINGIYEKNISTNKIIDEETFINKCKNLINYGIKNIDYTYDEELNVGKCKLTVWSNYSCTNWIENIKPDEEGYFNKQQEKLLLSKNYYYIKNKELL